MLRTIFITFKLVGKSHNTTGSPRGDRQPSDVQHFIIVKRFLFLETSIKGANLQTFVNLFYEHHHLLALSLNDLTSSKLSPFKVGTSDEQPIRARPLWYSLQHREQLKQQETQLVRCSHYNTNG
jgi:hypothetical protein